MNSIKRLIQATLFTGVGIFGVFGMVFAFNNLATQGGGSSTGGSSVGTLQQVTDLGKTTTNDITATYFTGSANTTSTFAGAIEVTGATVSSTRFWTAGNGVNDGYQLSSGLGTQVGFLKFGGSTSLLVGTLTTNNFVLVSNNTSRLTLSSGGGDFSPSLTDGTLTDLGRVNAHFKTLYTVGVSSTRGLFDENVTSTQFSAGAGSLTISGFNFGNAATPDSNSGLFQASANTVAVAANGVRYQDWRASDISIGLDNTPIVPLGANGTVDIGTDANRFDRFFVSNIHTSTTAGDTHTALAVSGTTMLAGDFTVSSTAGFAQGTSTFMGTVSSTNYIASGASGGTNGFTTNNGAATGYWSCSTSCFLGAQSSHNLVLFTGNSSRWTIDSNGVFFPSLTDGTLNIGSVTNRAGTVFASAVSSTTFSAAAGSAAAPSYHFGGAGQTDSGLYLDTGGRVAMSIDGALEMTWYTTHLEPNDDILPSGNGTLDLGSLVRQWHHVYANHLIASSTAGMVEPALITTGTIRHANLAATPAGINPLCLDAEGDGFIGAAGVCTPSTARVKEHFESLSSEQLMEMSRKLHAVSFDWKAGHESTNGTNANRQGAKGFIAEEVARIDPMLVGYVSQFSAEDLAFEKANYPDTIIVDDKGVTWIVQNVNMDAITVVQNGAIKYLDERLTKLEEARFEERISFLERVWRKVKSILKI